RDARELGDVGKRFIERRQPGLEAQIANVADEIAYNNHDIDDGLRSGLLRLEQLTQIPFFAEHRARVESEYPGADAEQLAREIVRQMIGALVGDLIEHSSESVAAAEPLGIDDVRARTSPLIGFSPPFVEAQRTLKRFLREHLYTHPHVQQMTERARETIRVLFATFSADHTRLPPKYAARAEAAEAENGAAGVAR